MKVVTWVRNHMAAVAAAFGMLLLGLAALLAEAVRPHQPIPEVLDPNKAAEAEAERKRVVALNEAEALRVRRETVEASIPTKPTPEEEAVSTMDAQALAAEWERLKSPARLAVVKGGKK